MNMSEAEATHLAHLIHDALFAYSTVDNYTVDRAFHVIEDIVKGFVEMP